MSRVPPTVASYAQASFGDPLPGMILYPALGAPEVLSRSDKNDPKNDHKWIHLLMLLPEGTDKASAKVLVNKHLKLLGDFGRLRDVKDGTRSLPAGLYTDLVADVDSHIKVKEFDQPPSKDGSGLDAIGWKGFLHKKMMDRYSTIPGLGTTVWEISVLADGLNGRHKEIWDQHSKLFLHWWDDKGDYQSNALYGILKDAKYSAEKGTISVPNTPGQGTMPGSVPASTEVPGRLFPLFVGERLRQDLSPDTGKRLWKGVDLETCPGQTDSDHPLMDIHPVYNLRKKMAGKPFNLGFISDLHLVNKFRILKNCDLYPIPKGGEGRGKDQNLKLEPVGKKIQDTVAVLAELIHQMATNESVDAIVFGGDLVDFCEDNWPKDKDSKYPSGETKDGRSARCEDGKFRFEHVWQSCWLDPDPLIREDNQQAGTTSLGLFHMILSKLVAATDKPVFILAGNHDAYQQPFGVSPRVFVGQALPKLPPLVPELGVGVGGALAGAIVLGAGTALTGGAAMFLGLGSAIWGAAPAAAAIGGSVGGALGGLVAALHAGCSFAFDIEAQKGNEGIPADCNLTVHEACLAFGPSYGTACLENSDIRLFGREKVSVNFVPDTMTLFYLLFNPLRSWTFPLGKHQMVVLDWGDGEGMMLGGDSFGHLPHATDTLMDDDLAVLEFAVEQGQSVTRPAPVISLSHFAWACCDPHVPIKGKAQPDPYAQTDDSSRVFQFAVSEPHGASLDPENDPTVTRYTYGACRRGRQKMFEYLAEGKVYLTLSGHTHRAGVYVLEKVDSFHTRGDRDDWKESAQEEAKVTAYHFDELEPKKEEETRHKPDDFPDLKALSRPLNSGSPPRSLLVVSDSAGPIPRENRGFFEGWGSARSSWTHVEFDDHGLVKTLKSRKASTTANSKPRMAVTLDYVEFMRCGATHGWWFNRDTASDRKKEMEEAEKKRNKGGKEAKEQAAKRAEIALDMAGMENATLISWPTLQERRLDPEASAPQIDAVRNRCQNAEYSEWKYFGYHSSLLTNFVSEPLDKDRIDAIKKDGRGFSFFHNHLAIDLPEKIKIRKVSLFVWEGMEVERNDSLEHRLKRCWLHLKPHGDGEWFLDPADNDATVLDDLRNVLSDHSGFLGSRPSHKSNVFLHLEFDQTEPYGDYNLSSPWIVHACWEDEWINDELGRRILIYRNTKAHENPDHELWRLAEYEGTEKTQNLPGSVANSSQKTQEK